MDLKSGEKVLFKDANSDALLWYNPLSHHRMVTLQGAHWIPAIGENKWDGHVMIAGATGSGKSYLINKLLEKDKQKKRERIMFTDFTDRDKTITSDYKKFGDRGIDTGFVQGNLEGGMFIFDDCTDPSALLLRDRLLEKGRHKDATVVCVNHRLRDGNITKKPINESRYIVTFPSSNRAAVAGFMDKCLEMPVKERREALARSTQEGRQLLFHMHFPNAIAATETAWLI